MKQKVLVIGAGRRAQNAILPALWCLQETHEILAVCSRHEQTLSLFDGKQSIKTMPLERAPVAEADLIMVAVKTSQVPSVLRSLLKHDVSKAVLMLDTPVVLPQHLLSLRLLKRFRSVRISEDTVALPSFLLARTLIGEGTIGHLTRITFFHSGYAYHALASVAMLANSRITSVRHQKFPMKVKRKEIHFGNDVVAVSYEPRDYATGTFVLEGENGVIADQDLPRKNVQRIGYLEDDGIYHGLTLNGEPVPPAGLDAAYLAHVPGDVFDKSLMNTMKLRALMDLIVDAPKSESPFHYDAATAVSDSLAVLGSEKLGRWPLHGIARMLLSKLL